MSSKRTWTTEGRGFEGASDSIIETHRPNLALDPGRRSGAGVVLLVFILVVGGLGFAAWWFRAELSGFLDGDGGDTEGAPESESEDAPGDGDETGDEGSASTPPPDLPAAAPPPPPQPKPSPWGGTPSGDPVADTPPTTGTTGTTGTPGTTGTTGATGPSAPAPEPTQNPPGPTEPPSTPATSVEVTRTSARITGSSSSRTLSVIDQLMPKLQGCADANRPSSTVALETRFTIKWNGGAKGVRVTGGETALMSCFRSTLARARYPQPPPGKDGVVRIGFSVSPG
jgi:hypothetical protein